MAESKRVSGRQASGSGRAPAATTSGRIPQARPSARVAAQPDPNGRTAPGAMKSSRRGGLGGGGEGAPVRKKRRRGGPELLIAFGVIALMGILALVLSVVRSKQRNEVQATLDDRERIFQQNMRLASEVFDRAEKAGMTYVLGQDDKATPDTLFGLFKSDDVVYNVIYDRNYKDKRSQTKTEQKAMYPDRLRLEKMERGKEENLVRMNYGFAENKTIPVVIASKQIKPKEGDNANLGGVITVIVKAQMDHVFEKAQQAKAPPPAGAPAAAPPPAEEKK